MNDEETDLRARAAKHAALADPTRLRITDLLTLGDLAPRELERRLEIPSNLLAHHLKTLEAAGLIIRTRSEGDGRRSYVQLVAGGAGSPTDPETMLPAGRVVFVCTANSARSQLAEHIWRRHSHIPAASAGTVPARSIALDALRVAAAHGLDLTGAQPQRLEDVRAAGDLYITVCDHAHESLATGDLHWSIPDPVAERGRTAFEDVYAQLERRVTALAPHVIAA